MKRIKLLLFLLSLLVIPMTIVKADLFASATFKTDTKGTGKLSDDYLYFELTGGSLITDANSFKAFVTTNQATYSSSCYENASAISSAGAVGISSIDSSTQKFKINLASDKMNTFAQSNEKVYVKMYVQNGSGQYCPSDTAVKEVNLATPAERLRDITITIDRKNTLELTDDVVTIKDAYITGADGYKVVLTKDVNNEGSANDGTNLVKSGNNYTFASSYYSSKVEHEEYVYLFIFKGTTLVKGGVRIDGFLGSEIFKNVKIEFENLKDDDQTNIKLKIKPQEVYPVSDDYIATFSKQESTSQVGSLWSLNFNTTGTYCTVGSKLEQVAVGEDTFYELKDTACYKEMAQLKGDTYVDFYKKIRTFSKICKYEIGANGNLAKNCPDSAVGVFQTYKKITSSIKINRPADLPLGKRINMNVTPSSSLFYMQNLSGITGGTNPEIVVRNATYKIGLVDDKSILRNLRDGENNAFEALLEYARKNSTKTTGTIKIQPNKAIATDTGAVAGALYTKDNVSDGSYYYLYINYDGKENGEEKYYPIEDVQIFKANKNTSGEIVLTTKDNIKWTDIGEDGGSGGSGESSGSGETGGESSKKKKNPKTGIISYTFIILSVTIIAVVFYIKTKKVTKFPQS